MTREQRLKPEHWLGLIGVLSTFAAAIAGAWVGGSIATNGARELQEDAAERASARELVAARTAVRLLLAEMADLRSNVVASGGFGCWLPVDYRLDVSTPDRRLLAARLPRNEWGYVLSAFRWEDFVALERHDGFEWIPGESSRDLGVVVGLTRIYDHIVPALSKFGGVPIRGGLRTQGNRYVRTFRSTGSLPRDARRRPELCRQPRR
jgi:hypothetical protein